MCHIPYDQNYTTQSIRIPSLAILPVIGKRVVIALPQRQPFLFRVSHYNTQNKTFVRGEQSRPGVNFLKVD